MKRSAEKLQRWKEKRQCPEIDRQSVRQSLFFKRELGKNEEQIFN